MKPPLMPGTMVRDIRFPGGSGMVATADGRDGQVIARDGSILTVDGTDVSRDAPGGGDMPLGFMGQASFMGAQAYNNPFFRI